MMALDHIVPLINNVQASFFICRPVCRWMSQLSSARPFVVPHIVEFLKLSPRFGPVQLVVSKWKHRWLGRKIFVMEERERGIVSLVTVDRHCPFSPATMAAPVVWFTDSLLERWNSFSLFSIEVPQIGRVSPDSGWSLLFNNVRAWPRCGRASPCLIVLHLSTYELLENTKQSVTFFIQHVARMVLNIFSLTSFVFL